MTSSICLTPHKQQVNFTFSTQFMTDVEQSNSGSTIMRWRCQYSTISSNSLVLFRKKKRKQKRKRRMQTITGWFTEVEILLGCMLNAEIAWCMQDKKRKRFLFFFFFRFSSFWLPFCFVSFDCLSVSLLGQTASSKICLSSLLIQLLVYSFIDTKAYVSEHLAT